MRRNGVIGAGGLIAGLLASVFLWLSGSQSRAHEVFPSIVEIEARDGVLHLAFEVTLEAVMAGIDLSEVEDTNAAPQAADYDALRMLPPAALVERLMVFAPIFAANVDLRVDGTAVAMAFDGQEIRDPGDPELVRQTLLRFSAPLPAGAGQAAIGWSRSYGTLIVRQVGTVQTPFTATLAGGETSASFALTGGTTQTGWQVFAGYIPIGFDHILPKGLDHILFVLGLFLLAAHLRPLLWQVTAFTAAHTVTLALGALGWVTVPGSIVEPLIAASIVYVAIENLFTDHLNPWRPMIVFSFGLLHGLGFASVLEEFGLPEAQFVPALLGFNVGVEFGQLTVIALAFLAVGAWFRDKPWYRARITNPVSLAIAAIGVFWVLERTVF
ncbi:HupE/UreJ family protein [Marimonas arenosa]|uniref:HupE/UreJ family protein n=1 Tax=Marimonas arenosa TaxID=1795305 RepID=A0AAE4B228_9RHOB|nr:HupE/UreJ family protein [Marimonas arenosa]MDQ2088623.1 HupE/UreJ family protein [Marimonas arenosa]